jgi:hypothetical protein
MPPRFLSFLPTPTGRMFQAVTHKTNPFFQAFERGGDRCQMLNEIASDQIRHEGQDALRLITAIRAWRGRCSLQGLHGCNERRETSCELFFHGVQPFAERRN